MLQRARKPQLGRYEVLFRLAGGGMAEVFVGRLLGEGGFVRYVAIKRMLPHLAEDTRFVDMFLDEGRLAGFVSSPNVVQTLDVGRDAEGALFIVMDLVRGASLHALLSANAKRNAYVPLPVAISILVDAARGLHDAHDATTPRGEPMHLVHRDVSPQNLLVGVDGRARITDFGVARAVHRTTATAVGELKGKLGYFAPEQARGQVDRRTDVFALGIVGWELLTGRRLFDGDDALQKLEKVRSMPIPAPSSRRAEVPAELDAVVAHALDRDLRTRCASAGELAEGLRDAARRAGIEPASPREVGAYVREVLGDAITNLERRLADAADEEARSGTEVLAGTHGTLGADGPEPLPHERPHTDERTTTEDPPTLASEWVTIEASHTRTTASTARVPGELRARARRSSAPWLAAAAVLVLAGAGFAAWWTSGDSRSNDDGARAAPAPASLPPTAGPASDVEIVGTPATSSESAPPDRTDESDRAREQGRARTIGAARSGTSADPSRASTTSGMGASRSGASSTTAATTGAANTGASTTGASTTGAATTGAANTGASTTSAANDRSARDADRRPRAIGESESAAPRDDAPRDDAPRTSTGRLVGVDAFDRGAR